MRHIRVAILSLLVLTSLPFIGQAQKSGGNKAKGKPPVQEQPVIFPNNHLPAEMTLRQGDKILSIYVTTAGEPSYTYFDGTHNGYGAINLDTGSFDSFQAVREAGKVIVTFSTRRLSDTQNLYKPNIALRGVVELDFTEGFFTIMTKARGTMSFEVLDGSRPSTTLVSEQGCVTTQHVLFCCAIGVLPGYMPHLPTH